MSRIQAALLELAAHYSVEPGDISVPVPLVVAFYAGAVAMAEVMGGGTGAVVEELKTMRRAFTAGVPQNHDR